MTETSVDSAQSSRTGENDDLAYKAFLEGRYDACLELLNSSDGESSDEWAKRQKILNKALVTFVQRKCDRADEYMNIIRATLPNLTKMNGGQALSHKVETISAYNLGRVAVGNDELKMANSLFDSILGHGHEANASVPDDVALCAALLRIECALQLCQPVQAVRLMDALTTKNIWSRATKAQTTMLDRVRERAACLLGKRLTLDPTPSSSNSSAGIRHLLCRCQQLVLGNGDALTILRELCEQRAATNESHYATVFDNAIGCVYASVLRKPNLANSFFYLARVAAVRCSKGATLTEGAIEGAIEGTMKGTIERNLPMLSRYALLYNTGLCWLECNMPEYAFDHLITVIRAFPTNARIWLRLAESCISATRSKTTENTFELQERMHEIMKQLVGSAQQNVTFGSNAHTRRGYVRYLDERALNNVWMNEHSIMSG
jgi:hypothetical protein